jgi:hypothetical protein
MPLPLAIRSRFFVPRIEVTTPPPRGGRGSAFVLWALPGNGASEQLGNLPPVQHSATTSIFCELL